MLKFDNKHKTILKNAYFRDCDYSRATFHPSVNLECAPVFLDIGHHKSHSIFMVTTCRKQPNLSPHNDDCDGVHNSDANFVGTASRSSLVESDIAGKNRYKPLT